jgi:predicted phage terminase large subunit-like protein
MLEEIRKRAEQDLEVFINLVAPERVLGQCHKEVIQWWTRPDAKQHQLLLFPRDHMKSALVAYRVAWELTRDPTLRVLYISSTANLAEKQLGFIKNILTNPIYSRYWPEHVEREEGKRTKWASGEICLDHPLRKKENIRDPSVFTAGLTTSITGMHCDIAVLDDVVVNENAYTQEGRRKVQTQYSLLSSIEGADSKEWVVGTRYHPADLYNDMMEMLEIVYDEEGNEVDEVPIYEVHQKVVEVDGEFLWPRQQRKDGKWFGFNMQILSKKRGKYLDKMQFYAQYYNDPNDPETAPIISFQYFDRKYLTQENGHWYIKNKKLNLTAAIDFAYSTRKRADYTAIVVVGVDDENTYYVLDIERFKTTKIADYFEKLLNLNNKWSFKKLVCETSNAQQSIVRSLKEDYFIPYGLNIKIVEVKPTKHDGTKEERMDAVLTPRYQNGQIFHYRGGNTQILEEELLSYAPPHDDVKDALANAIDNAVKPTRWTRKQEDSKVVYHPRFGGRAF